MHKLARNTIPWLMIVLISVIAALPRSEAVTTNSSQKSQVPAIKIDNHGRDIMVVDQKNRITTLAPPFNIHSTGRMRIRLLGKPDSPRQPKDIPLADRIQARRLLLEANQAFFKGDIPQSWQLLDQAETLNPRDYRVLSMKGSLLYQTGSKDLAREMWTNSLLQNPNQPDITAMLNKLPPKSPPSKDVATTQQEVTQ